MKPILRLRMHSMDVITACNEARLRYSRSGMPSAAVVGGSTDTVRCSGRAQAARRRTVTYVPFADDRQLWQDSGNVEA